MKKILLLTSVAFTIYGFLPYKFTTKVNVSNPNQLLVRQQECGCPCPNAAILDGYLFIPKNFNLDPTKIDTTQLNIEDFNELFPMEIASSNLYIEGKVIALDNLLCEPENCILIPRFTVESWGFTDYVAKAWTFPKLLGFLFLFNSFIWLPALLIKEIFKKRN